MKKISAFIAVFLSASILFASGVKDPDVAPLGVGATSKPHAEMLKIISSDLARHGITLEIVESDNYDQLNADVENGKLDANLYGHQRSCHRTGHRIRWRKTDMCRIARGKT